MLDFLYSDHERVASLIAQIDGVGSLISYERTSGKEKGRANEAGLNFSILSASHGRSENLNRELRQQYDPLWSNSSKFLEIVSSKELKQDSDLDYGALVTKTGKLACLDQALFNNLLESPAIVEQIAAGMDSEESARSGKIQQKQKKEIASIIRDFVKSLPLGVVLILFTEDNVFWFNVKREYLQLQSLDIPLKFPVQIGGVWHVTGIVDAMPQDHADLVANIADYGDKLVFPQALSIIAQLIAPLVGLFGRPADVFGLSPITIHREISF